MHIIRFQGGLGNQMFQYALYRKFQIMGYDTYADLQTYKNGKEKRNLDILKFGIQLNESTKKNNDRLAGKENNKIDWVLRKIFPKKTYIYEKGIEYNPIFLKKNSGYFNGYWQSEKYFSDIRDILIEEFCFDKIAMRKKSKYEIDIRRTKSVSIHLRLGDYLNANEIYGGICTKEYYSKAVSTIKDKNEDVIFYVFSNDISLAKEILEDKEQMIFVDENDENDGLFDMYLMSICKHNIIANSSFSWWAAWLNQNRQKMVICPSKWINNQTADDILCKDWIKL